MNWNSPAVLKSLQDLRETLSLQGRDSRIVRAAFAYSRRKKRVLSALRQTFLGFGGKRSKNPNRLRVLFFLPGGMGDAACARRLVEAYRALLPQADFEIYSPVFQAAQTVFCGMPNVTFVSSSRIYWKNYDLVVQACLTVKFLYADEKRLTVLGPAFLPVLKQAQQAQQSLGILLEDPFLTEPALGRWLVQQGGRRFDLMSFTGGVELVHDADTHLSGFVPSRGKYGLAGVAYVTFHDGTGHSAEKSSSARSWPQAHWTRFIHLFKEKFPHIQLVQLGGANSPAYAEADVCLAGKTQLTDLPDILDGSLCHVDTESGLIHLAQFVAVKSVVLFGPSDLRFFGYAKNKNIAAGECGGCMWMRTDWMSRCPLGKPRAGCMQEISPEQVLIAVQDILSAR